MRKHLLAVILQLAVSGADAYLTDRAMHTPGWQEKNPVTRAFVHNRPELVTWFALTAAGDATLPFILRHYGHSKLARAAEVEGIADNTAGIVYTEIRAKR